MRIKAVAYSTRGCRLLIRLKEQMGDELDIWCKTSSDDLGIRQVEGSNYDWTEDAFDNYDAIVSIGALGIAVRHIAPFIKRKDRDPAVIDIDEAGRFTICVLSGHIGGGNRLAERIASLIDSRPVITTATDINMKFKVDMFASDNQLRISSLKDAKEASARILDGRFIGLSLKRSVSGDVPDGLTVSEDGEFGIAITDDPEYSPFERTLVLVPKDIIIGVGCKRGTDPIAMRDFIKSIFADLGLSTKRIFAIASIDLKKDEEAISYVSKIFDADVRFFSADELMSLNGEFSSSEFVKRITSVDCVCERSAVMAGGDLILKKTAKDGMTVALSKRKMELRF